MARKIFLREQSGLHEKVGELGFALKDVRRVDRSRLLGNLTQAHDAYIDAHYSMPPANAFEKFNESEVNAISIRLRKVLSEHEDVIDHHLIEDQQSALLRLVLRVKLKK